MAELISWEVATRVGKSVADYFPTAPAPEVRSLESDLQSVFPEAQEQVTIATGLEVPPEASPLVMSRSEWVEANIKSFKTTLTPLLERLSEKAPRWPFAGASSFMAGAQLGTILGWMSSKVLGQFDVILADANNDMDLDRVYFVASNIIAVEMKYGFNERQFRHWIALHELTHRAQFRGVTWMREYFQDLVQEAISFANPDPAVLFEGFKKVYSEIREGRNPLSENGPLGLFASEEQLESLSKITGLMSLLEGHGDVIMNRAGADDILESKRFAQVLSQRRNEQKGLSRLMSQLLGLDAKMKQYQEGEAFVEEVERVGGMPLFNKVWVQPDNLPNLTEIRDPSLWIERLTTKS